MNRKMQKTMMRDGQRRRSPRILASGACKENGQEKKPVQYFRKRKFDGAADLTSTSKLTKQVWKGRDNIPDDDDDDDDTTKHVEWKSIHIPEIIEENQKRDDQGIRNGPSVMPAKHILELVLDTLQRRDTYEIFAEPVDPLEVEDYNEIIKEPMDFGTMRAKLHEGMYQNLEQFEHDVFLIPENAMYFNSSATVYYRQARAIHELAQKVFDAFKTDPENFVLEFSGTRRRSMRKAWTEVPSKGMLHSQPGSSTFRRARKNQGCSGMTDRFRPRNSSTGNRDDRLSDFEVTDRRSTYWTHGSSFNRKTKHVGSSFYSSSQPLVLRNQGEISYKDSLMSFVKDLGPIAQRVAKRKLSSQHEPNSTTPSEKNLVSTSPRRKRENEDSKTTSYRTFSDFASGTPPFLKISNTIDLTKDGEDESSSRNGRLEFGTPAKRNTDFGLSRKEISDFSTPVKEKSDFSTLVTQRREFSAMVNEKTKQCIPSKEKMDDIAKGKEKLDRAITLTKDQETVTRARRSEMRKVSMKNKNIFNLKDTANCDQDFRPVILALENPHCNKATEHKPRNKKNFAQVCNLPAQTKTVEKECNMLVETKVVEKEGGSSLPQANPPVEASKPVASQYMFGIPFLQARLSEMSSKRQEGFSMLRASGSLSEMNTRGREGFTSLAAGGSLSEMIAKGREGFSLMGAGGNLSEMNPKRQEGFPSLRVSGSLSKMNAKEPKEFSLLHADGSLSNLNTKGPEGFSSFHVGKSFSKMSAKGPEGLSSLRAGGSSSKMNAKGPEYSSLHVGETLREMYAKGPGGFSSLRTGESSSEMKTREREGFSTFRAGDHHQLKRPQMLDQGESDRSLNCSLDINKPYVFDSLETNLALQL